MNVPISRLRLAIKAGEVKYLKEVLDGAPDNEIQAILSERLEDAIMVRRPSNGKEIYIRSPTLLILAVCEWFPDVLAFLASFKQCVNLSVTVEDVTTKPAVYQGVTVLHLAAIAGKLTMVQTLVESGADVNAQTSLGGTALYEACFEGHLGVVKYLAEHAADAELPQTWRDTTCLMAAAHADNVPVIQYLVNNGADVGHVDKEGRNVLFYTISGGRLDTLCFLLDHGAPAVEDYQRVNLLMEAVSCGQIEIVQYLLQYNDLLELELDALDCAGRNVLFYALNRPDTDLLEFLLHFDIAIEPANDGRTLLMSACLNNNMTVIKYLVEHADKLGLDIHAKDVKGRNTLFYAITGGDMTLFQYFLDNGIKVEPSSDGVSVVMQAVAKNKSDMLVYFLEHCAEFGVDVNQQDADGWSAMLYAAASCHRHMFETLAAYGAECRPAHDGRTVLMQAAAKGHLEILQLLCDHAQDYSVYLNQKDNDGWTCLFYPIQGNHLEAFRYLIKRGAKMCAGNNGHTVLMEAVGKNRPDFVHFLVNGAGGLTMDINQVDKDGNNVLFYAAAGGNLSLLKMLITAGCLVQNDFSERNILMQAALHGHVAMVEYLATHATLLELDLHQKDKDHRNVLFYCVEGGHLGVLKYFLEKGVAFCSDKDGRTNLMQACRIGHVPIVDYMTQNSLTLDININARDKHGENALFYASRSKNLKVIQCLLDFGIEVISNKYGVNVLAQSLAEGSDLVVTAIFTSKCDISGAVCGKDVRGKTVLHHYVDKGDLEMVQHLGEHYRPADDHDIDGVSMLMYACTHNTPEHLKVVQYLLTKLKVDICHLDHKHRDALYYACQHSNPEAARLLLHKLTRVHCDTEARNPLMVAAANGTLAVCKVLLESEFCTHLCETRDNMGRQALHYWAMNGRESRILDLLKQQPGSSQDARDNEGMTPVMYACAGGHGYALLTLLRGGADVDLTDNEEKNALHYCFRKIVPSLKCIKLLVKYHVFINQPDSAGVTPLMLAAQTCSKSDINLIRVLLEHGADPVIQDNEGKDAFDYCPFDAEYVKALMREKAKISSLEQKVLEKYKEEMAALLKVNSVLRGLLKEKVFTKTLNFEVMKKAQTERIGRLLELLVHRGEGAFRIFCDVVKQEGEVELSYNLKRESYQKEEEIFW